MKIMKKEIMIKINLLLNTNESTLKRKEDWNILYNFFQKK